MLRFKDFFAFRIVAILDSLVLATSSNMALPASNRMELSAVSAVSAVESPDSDRLNSAKGAVTALPRTVIKLCLKTPRMLNVGLSREPLTGRFRMITLCLSASRATASFTGKRFGASAALVPKTSCRRTIWLDAVMCPSGSTT